MLDASSADAVLLDSYQNYSFIEVRLVSFRIQALDPVQCPSKGHKSLLTAPLGGRQVINTSDGESFPAKQTKTIKGANH